MLRQMRKPAFITRDYPHSYVSEHYRQLRTNITQLLNEGRMKSIAVTSANQGEGKTTTVINLAISFAMGGKRTVIVDADLRRPSVHQVFNVGKSLGLSSLLNDTTALDQVLRETEIEHLWALPAGAIPDNPAELLSGQPMNECLQQLQSRFDVVLVDCPPVLPVVDSKIIANKCDGVVLVVLAGRTKVQAIKKVKQQFEIVKANLLGTVLNGQEKYKSEWYDYY
ncbi:CpsD/CapB family tyrosine-protein kinase [Paenibacillus profundus]|uniref:non-specific protein-tyrosine kinase n=1 Tax=Paenibacillus profundus TaxID=1173085 RepID=A0ABS8YEI6_9BACL|nr:MULTISPECIES: CpsD/CapB family tyrosine-protein kinase [Paenibacillus]MCE5168925.1 CpsD/CapB family tyrosine-protein kinase [Paenibacillus profundus]